MSKQGHIWNLACCELFILTNEEYDSFFFFLKYCSPSYFPDLTNWASVNSAVLFWAARDFCLPSCFSVPSLNRNIFQRYTINQILKIPLAILSTHCQPSLLCGSKKAFVKKAPKPHPLSLRWSRWPQPFAVGTRRLKVIISISVRWFWLLKRFSLEDVWGTQNWWHVYNIPNSGNFSGASEFHALWTSSV